MPRLRLATALPVRHLGPVSDTSKLPSGWRVVAVPTDWDPSDERMAIRTVQAGYVTLPCEYFMVIQTSDMVAEDVPTAVTVTFRATEEGAHVAMISGVGSNWFSYFDEVVATFPSSEWGKCAEGLIVNFLRLPEARAAAGEAIRALPRRDLDNATTDRPLDAGIQRRRKLTPEHLKEVAQIYSTAQAHDEPPTRSVQHHFGVSHSTAAKWVGAARRATLLPPVGDTEE